MARLAYSDAALRDLGHIKAWLLQPGSGHSARQRWMFIGRAIRSIGRHPLLGSVDEDDIGLRRFAVERHLVLYEVDPKHPATVTIFRVFGPGQQTNDV